MCSMVLYEHQFGKTKTKVPIVIRTLDLYFGRKSNMATEMNRGRKGTSLGQIITMDPIEWNTVIRSTAAR